MDHLESAYLSQHVLCLVIRPTDVLVLLLQLQDSCVLLLQHLLQFFHLLSCLLSTDVLLFQEELAFHPVGLDLRIF